VGGEVEMTPPRPDTLRWRLLAIAARHPGAYTARTAVEDLVPMPTRDRPFENADEWRKWRKSCESAKRQIERERARAIRQVGRLREARLLAPGRAGYRVQPWVRRSVAVHGAPDLEGWLECERVTERHRRLLGALLGAEWYPTRAAWLRGAAERSTGATRAAIGELCRAGVVVPPDALVATAEGMAVVGVEMRRVA